MPLSQLIQALETAFDLPALREMLRRNLSVEIEGITTSGDLHQAVMDLVARAEEEGWTIKLLEAARAYHPFDTSLRAVADQIGLAPRMVVAIRPSPLRERRYHDDTLEKIIVGTNSLLDLAAWRDRLGEIEYQVCRLEIRQKAVGTGFLVGPDLLMTCYHVVEALIKGKERPQDLVARFDYKIARNQAVANPGREFRLAADWLYDFSPYNAQEAAGQEDALPTAGELDFALLRLAEAPGSQPVSEKTDDASPRSWVEISGRTYDFPQGSPLFIVQHPSGGPLKLALDTQAILGLNSNGTRVRYRTNTAAGSSGSPCFNSEWELVALHHSGIVKYNEGVPVALIADFLKQRGKWFKNDNPTH
jgi:hypothetical protein